MNIQVLCPWMLKKNLRSSLANFCFTEFWHNKQNKRRFAHHYSHSGCLCIQSSLSSRMLGIEMLLTIRIPSELPWEHDPAVASQNFARVEGIRRQVFLSLTMKNFQFKLVLKLLQTRNSYENDWFTAGQEGLYSTIFHHSFGASIRVFGYL